MLVYVAKLIRDIHRITAQGDYMSKKKLTRVEIIDEALKLLLQTRIENKDLKMIQIELKMTDEEFKKFRIDLIQTHL